MAINTLTHVAPVRGVVPHASAGTPSTMTGFRPAGREVRPDAGQPRPASIGGTAQVPLPFTPPEAQPSNGHPVFSDEERGQAREMAGNYLDQLGEGPAFGGAAYNGGGGQLANAISGTVPHAIESGAENVIADAIESAL